MNTYFAVFFFTVRGFECPTCFKRFPIEEIEEHADLCASHIIEFGDDTCPGEATTSDDCRLERTAEIWIDDHEQNDLTYSTLIKTVQKNMEKDQPVRINIRRKTLWEDFVRERNRRVKPEKLVKVVFIGEPAIDDGGPRREFFSGEVQFIYTANA